MNSNDAREAAVSFLNGNRNHVAKTCKAGTPAFTAQVMWHGRNEGWSDYDFNVFLSLMENASR